MGSVNVSGWTSANYAQAKTDALSDFSADATLGANYYNDVVTGIAVSDAYSTGVAAQYFGTRFSFTLTATQKSRLSSVAVLSRYAAWWLKGYRRQTGNLREAQDFIEVDGSMCFFVSTAATPFDDGADLASTDPDLDVTWSDVNADHAAEGSTLSSMQWVRYLLPQDVVTRIRAQESLTVYLWVWADDTSLQYLGDKSAEFRMGTSSTYGWEIVCGPVDTSSTSSGEKFKLRIGQDA
jgi:hypothetical protein